MDEIHADYENILKNKAMIKEMVNTNILVYEEIIRTNNEKIKELKEEISRINSDFLLVENKLKLDYAKTHEQFQKHDINYKLLDKTCSHYRSLAREREDDIRKSEDQTLFAHQDYQNKKIKLDCVNVQITEAEFQLKRLQKLVQDKIHKITIEEEIEETSSNSTMALDKYVEDKMEYKSYYMEKQQSRKSQIDQFTLDNLKLNKHPVKNKCVIY